MSPEIWLSPEFITGVKMRDLKTGQSRTLEHVA